MPTPFTHLEISQRLLMDASLSPATRALIAYAVPDFLLGSIVADAKPAADAPRHITHFYEYTKPMPDNPWREMFRQHPSLRTLATRQHQAFVAGYVAHLAADEYWSRRVLKPHFALAEWGTDARERFYMLHFLLIYMDERDEASLQAPVSATLRQAVPQSWLPFMGDDVIQDWRDYIAEQLVGQSDTLHIFGQRISTPAEEVRRLLDDNDFMQTRLWQNIPPKLFAQKEVEMYAFVCQELERYVTEFL